MSYREHMGCHIGSTWECHIGSTWGCHIGSTWGVIVSYREHMGVSRMKALARSHVWWKGLDKDLRSWGGLAVLAWL